MFVSVQCLIIWTVEQGEEVTNGRLSTSGVGTRRTPLCLQCEDSARARGQQTWLPQLSMLSKERFLLH